MSLPGAGTGSDNSAKLRRLVLISAFLGWMFDSMDLNIFTLILVPCISELTGATDANEVARIGGLVVGAKLFAWGCGGVFFGVAADRYGRSRVMAITILLYSVFTGLSAFAQTWQQLAVFQALAGLGIGGEWAAGAALVAEYWAPEKRSRAIQIMQMAFAFGFMAAALNNLLLGSLGWRWVLGVGVLPAVLTVFLRRFIPEPEMWRIENEKGRGVHEGFTTKIAALFSASLRRPTIVGVLIASAAMVGSWGGLTLMPNWIRGIIKAGGIALSPQHVTSVTFMLMMAGAIVGYVCLALVGDQLGRRNSYFIFWSGSLAVSLCMFSFVSGIEQLYLFAPVYGFFVIGGFGTFAAYLPELFPTRVRATGQGFCWNVARILTSIGPLAIGAMLHYFHTFSMVASVLSLFILVGLASIWFGPETSGRRLE